MNRSTLLLLGISALLAGLTPACAAAGEDEGDVEEGNAAQSAAVWLEFSPKARNNPWDACDSGSSGGAAVMGFGGGSSVQTPSGPEATEGAKVRSCLGESKITLKTIAFLQPNGGGGGCASLDCPRGDRLVVQASNAASVKALEGLGFTKLKTKLVAQDACKDVPFAVTSGFEQQFGATKLVEFTKKEKAPTELAGIGFAPVAKSACAYRAIVAPKDAAAGKALDKAGFEKLD